MLRVIIAKEIKRVLSDKRLVFTVFILPGVSLFIIYSFMGSFIGNIENTFDEYKPKIYIQNAPENFTSYFDNSLYAQNYDTYYITSSEDAEVYKDKIIEDEIDLLIVFDNGFEDRIINYETTDEISNINTFYNSNDNYSSYSKNSFVNEVLGEYEDNLLAARFGNLNHINAFDIDKDNAENDLANEKEKAGRSLSFFFPLLISIFLFAGAMGVGPDIIAGEKERGTMATLLLTPLDRHYLALGKIISLGIVSLLSSASLFVGIVASLPYSSSFLGTGDLQLSALEFGTVQYLELIIILLSLAAIYVSIICFISVQAKTVKEANSYLAPCYMVVVFFAIMSSTNISTPETWRFLIPIYGNIISLQGFLTFNLTGLQLLLSSLSSLFISGVLIVLITNKFNDEKIIL